MCRSSVFIVLGLVVMVAAVSQARYLPTRADDSRLDEIRELIRELLERTAEGGNNRMMANSGYEKRPNTSTFKYLSRGTCVSSAGHVPLRTEDKTEERDPRRRGGRLNTKPEGNPGLRATEEQASGAPTLAFISHPGSS
ncbi:hypothetical protein C7M84_001168 [Penaeus vannamei]|uniref:Uncharacterized protein n=1 Tax=Penaeus vannamei TaxID=6689 RepID=A0A3R7QVT7_PENVA|nr:hypothetical protein C7M84_001168 [Penaeus vannamei]